MKLLGLIGNPVSQSRSPEIFRSFFEKEGITDTEYRLFPLQNIEEFKTLIAEHPELIGLNVTIPFKKSIIPFLTKTDRSAERLGSINTIKIDGDELTGYNTDFFGFRKSLLETFSNLPKTALILGSGGSSNAVSAVLDDLGIAWKKISRSGMHGENYVSLNSHIIAANPLIINTTPLGMGVFQNERPSIPYEGIGVGHCCFDLVYHSEKTPFLLECGKQGAQIKNGSDMLLYQARKSWEIFKGY